MLEGEQVHELAIFNHTRVVLVHLFNQCLNVYRHFKLGLDNVDERSGIDVATPVFVATEGHKGI